MLKVPVESQVNILVQPSIGVEAGWQTLPSSQLVGVWQVAVDFWAPWCEPCKTLDQVFAMLAADNGHAKFLRVRPPPKLAFARLRDSIQRNVLYVWTA